MKLRFTFILMCLSVLVHAQTLTQTLRGTVTDKTTQKALQGANLILQPGEIKTSTDEKGTFIFENTPAGRYSIRVSFTGYNTAIINEIIVATGKQTVINIELLPSVTMLSEASVSNANQDIEAVQSRTFTVEQSQRYAAVFNDAGRMAALYPGVALTDDGNKIGRAHV